MTGTKFILAPGLGSCWIHRAKEVFEGEEGRRLLKEWGIAEDYEGIGNVIIGFADGKAPEASPRLDHRVITIE